MFDRFLFARVRSLVFEAGVWVAWHGVAEGFMYFVNVNGRTFCELSVLPIQHLRTKLASSGFYMDYLKH